MSVLMTLDFLKKTGRFGRECCIKSTDNSDSDGIGGWDRVVIDAHPSDARYFRELKDYGQTESMIEWETGYGPRYDGGTEDTT